MADKLHARAKMSAAVAGTIIVGFFAAYFSDPSDETMKGALIAAFAGAWGFYLGSSQGARDSREALHRQIERQAGTPDA